MYFGVYISLNSPWPLKLYRFILSCWKKKKKRWTVYSFTIVLYFLLSILINGLIAKTYQVVIFCLLLTLFIFNYLNSSVGKESTCNAGDPGSIPGLGRSPGEGIGCPLQYSWASLVAQLVKNPPAMWETWLRSLGWEDPLERGTAIHSGILAWRTPWTV